MKIPLIVALFVFLYVGLAKISDGSIPTESDAYQKSELYANMIITDSFNGTYLQPLKPVTIHNNSNVFIGGSHIVHEAKAVFLQGLFLMCVGFVGRRMLSKNKL